MPIGYIPHVLDFALYMWVLLVAGQNFWFNRHKVNDRLRATVYMFVVFQISAVAAYLYNQSMWLLEHQQVAIGLVTSPSWMVHDYFNGVFHLTAATLSTHYIKEHRTRSVLIHTSNR